MRYIEHLNRSLKERPDIKMRVLNALNQPIIGFQALTRYSRSDISHSFDIGMLLLAGEVGAGIDRLRGIPQPEIWRFAPGPEVGYEIPRQRILPSDIINRGMRKNEF